MFRKQRLIESEASWCDCQSEHDHKSYVKLNCCDSVITSARREWQMGVNLSYIWIIDMFVLYALRQLRSRSRQEHTFLFLNSGAFIGITEQRCALKCLHFRYQGRLLFHLTGCKRCHTCVKTHARKKSTCKLVTHVTLTSPCRLCVCVCTCVSDWLTSSAPLWKNAVFHSALGSSALQGPSAKARHLFLIRSP